MTNLKLTDSIIRAGANERVFARAQELFRNNAISDAAIQGNILTGYCEGMQSPFYKVRDELDRGGVRAASCDCEYDFGGYCKHIVALLLTFARDPERFVVRDDMTKRLAELGREQLLALLTELLDEVPDLSDWLETAIPEPAARQSRLRADGANRRVAEIPVENQGAVQPAASADGQVERAMSGCRIPAKKKLRRLAEEATQLAQKL
ncbi:MAG: hypothetical protein JMDDDDMK_04688 [Acidobacteria bacterium]|nr:hypothetical protein [Acidobacteriota bacterium]